VVETVDRDRFLAALYFSDELSAQPCAVAKTLLAQPALLTHRAQTLTEVLSDMFDGSFRHDAPRHPELIFRPAARVYVCLER